MPIEPKIKASASADEQSAKILRSLSHLNDPIVIELLIRIINLIEYFCLQAAENQVNTLFNAIAQSLNNNNRETALFNCLAIPDDDVRLAVVKCLYVVPVDQFDSDEISQICKIIVSCVNIGAGKTELVLSTIYWILTKFVIGDPNEDSENVYKTF